MGPTANQTDVRSLQRRAEQALRSAKPRDYVVRLLQELVTAAPSDSEAARFAHRHLAELRLEESPWQAALHLRHVLSHDADDDVAQALMGLCQALLANFRSAVAAYRRAVALSPANPWYNHNLGHLLDAALGNSHDALPYLRRAHRLEPSQDEVSASLAHCLGRVGAAAEGAAIAQGLVQRNPRDADLRSLLEWLEQGAPPRAGAVTGLLSTLSPSASGARGKNPSVPPPPSGDESIEDEAARLLQEAMAAAGRPTPEVKRACRILADYRRAEPARGGRAAVVAAAVEYALARLDGASVSQREIAERYGVSLSAVQSRYASLRASLGLTERDPRYTRAATPRPSDNP